MLKPTLLAIASLTTLFAAAPDTSTSTRSAASPNRQTPNIGSQDAQVFDIDTVHSSVLFRIQHLQAAPFYGRFNAIEGQFSIDAESPENSSFEVAIPAASVDSNNEQRDKHLRSGDFFSVKEFETIELRSKSVRAAGEGAFQVIGDLTLRGQTREVEFTVEHTGTAEVSDRFGLRSGYETTFTIDRTDFGMDFYAKEGVLGTDVRLTVAIEGVARQ